MFPEDSILDAVHKSYADLDLYVTVASNLRAMSDIIDFLVIAIDSEDDRTGAPPTEPRLISART